MASLCKRQQCTIERRGFRQELDSWRHKLIHCVGFESILEGLFGPGLVKDLTVFKDCEPEGVSDWSFNKNCLFCCLRREKVKEHLVGLDKQALAAGEKALCKQEQSKIHRLEKQAEEFLHAVFYRKDVPRVSDPHIPLVAREIMQRMIRQFAAEYTSKTSSSQDPIQPNGTKDQSLPKAPSLASAAASAQNPVLSKLLMADQDSPLDLTVKKSESESSDQDGVLDLSTKKSPSPGSSSLNNSPSCSTGPLEKGDSEDLSQAKAIDDKPPASLEQFMAKLCPHHQKQIVDALGFLQNEVMPVAFSTPSQSPQKVSPGAVAETDCSPVCQLQITMARGTEQGTSSLNPPFSDSQKSFEIPTTMGSINDSIEVTCVQNNPNEQASLTTASKGNAVLASSYPYRSIPLDHLPLVSGDLKELKCNETAREDIGHSDKVKSSTSCGTVCVSKVDVANKVIGCCPTDGTLDDLQSSSETTLYSNFYGASQSIGVALEPGSLHPSLGRTGQVFDHLYHAEKNGSLGDTKDVWLGLSPDRRATKTTVSFRCSSSPASPKTARKSIRGPYLRPRSSALCQIVNDLDNQCDIVYISKPITECDPVPQKPIFSRRTARKSTRGHMCSEEYWELKTVRTLARKSAANGKGNCPSLMPESITLVTPKQVLAMPDSVPPTDVPFAGSCGETLGQNTPSKETLVKEIGGDVYVVGLDVAQIVETSKTDQPRPEDGTSQPLKALLSLVKQQSKETEEQQTKMPLTNEICAETVIQTDQSEEEPSSDRQTDEKELDSEQPEEIPIAAAVMERSELGSEMLLENAVKACVSELQPTSRSTSPMVTPDDLQVEDTRNDIGTMVETLELQKSEQQELHLVDNNAVSKEGSPKDKIILQQSSESCISVCGSKDEEMEEESTDTVMETDVKHKGLEVDDERSTPENTCMKKRHRKVFATSDRLLRSQQQTGISDEAPSNMGETISETTPSPLQVPELQVILFKSPGAKRFRKSVELKQTDVVSFPANCFHKTILEGIGDPDNWLGECSESSSDEEIEEKNVLRTRQNYKSMLAKELESDEDRESGSISTFEKDLSSKREGLWITVKANSERRRVLLSEEEGVSPLLNSELVGGKPGDSMGKILERFSKMHSDKGSNCLLNGRGTVKPMTSKALMRHKKRVLKSYNLQCPEVSMVGGRKGIREQYQARADVGVLSDPFGLTNVNLSVKDPPKFLEALTEEENQDLITNLNGKYEKVHKGWVQLEKEGQPAPKPKNKADRLKEIWKSKRRVRRSKALDQQRFSPVQMLFMKTFNLANICRWFLETTETKSLVIVKKTNTRLPSETQLCFHNSSSSAAGSSRDVYPSIQAERLKKHLKKFAMASPAKNNIKNQQLWARASEHTGANGSSKERLRKEISTATRISTKPSSNHIAPKVQVVKNQKTPQGVKSPASARILRKYSNIRGKLQVQQHRLKTNETSGMDHKSMHMKPLISPILASGPKSGGPQRGRPLGSKEEKEKKIGSRRTKVAAPPVTRKGAAEERGTKSNSRPSALYSKNRHKKLLKKTPVAVRKPQRITVAANVSETKQKGKRLDTKEVKTYKEADRMQEAPQLRGMRFNPNEPSDSKDQSKSPKTRAMTSTLPPLSKVAVVSSQDQVLTRSQRKLEVSGSLGLQTRKRVKDIKPALAKRTRRSNVN
ncbi:uncharacterized protein LOC117418627 isoform X1 [Acipenser ruthenus]|uniref:uncharacterized protein LOC117418627 isoform X1 n=1 Tax=Acipenser ruthenus TaxID=7906 RepID=UPI0027428A80|nr:uncharacterized protein LOC117418627 isoform X1 [Acipenser ruthenus]